MFYTDTRQIWRSYSIRGLNRRLSNQFSHSPPSPPSPSLAITRTRGIPKNENVLPSHIGVRARQYGEPKSLLQIGSLQLSTQIQKYEDSVLHYVGPYTSTSIYKYETECDLRSATTNVRMYIYSYTTRGRVSISKI